MSCRNHFSSIFPFHRWNQAAKKEKHSGEVRETREAPRCRRAFRIFYFRLFEFCFYLQSENIFLFSRIVELLRSRMFPVLYVLAHWCKASTGVEQAFSLLSRLETDGNCNSMNVPREGRELLNIQRFLYFEFYEQNTLRWTFALQESRKLLGNGRKLWIILFSLSIFF